MIQPAGDRSTPISPALAVRVAVLGVAAFALFGIIFFRLWYLQVLTGDQYLAQAQTNQVRRERIEAPRGQIQDRNGKVLVSNELSNVVKVDPGKLPTSEREAIATYGAARIARAKRPDKQKGPSTPIPAIPVDLAPRFERLGKVLGMKPATIQERVVKSVFLASYSPATVKIGVSDALRDYLAERVEDFPGIDVSPVYLRSYPETRTAAQLLGSVSQISDAQLKSGDTRFKGILPATRIGQSGLESEYDRYLRGTDGIQRLRVDAQGDLVGVGSKVEPSSGRDLQLTLDLGLQKAADANYIRRAGADQPGAVVAMDPRSGAILAMDSFPTFNPADLAKPLSDDEYEAKFGKQAGSPLFPRYSGAYPTGSTFKPFTALASLKAGIIGSTTQVQDNGFIIVGKNKERFQNAKAQPNGTVDMVKALRVSSDVYFYRLGQAADRKGPIIQREARSLGLGRYTGLDLPGAAKGVLPDRQWRDDLNQLDITCRQKHKLSIAVGPVAQSAALATPYRNCGISDLRPWTFGDNMNTSVGQGDVQASPLQMAVAYSAIANGGTVPRPHLGLQVTDAGRAQQRISHPPARKVKIDPADREVVMRGLYGAANEDGGTSADVFKGWNRGRFKIFGKTGTAQKGQDANGIERPDQSWYVVYAYDGSPSNHPITVAVTAERGGFGATTAAPIACRILAKWFSQPNVPCSPGGDQTR